MGAPRQGAQDRGFLGFPRKKLGEFLAISGSVVKNPHASAVDSGSTYGTISISFEIISVFPSLQTITMSYSGIVASS